MTFAFRLLTKDQKKYFAFLLFLTVISTFLEIVGIGAIIPLINIIISPDAIANNEFLSNIFQNIGISKESFILLFLIIFLIIFILKSLFLVLLSYVQIRFIFFISIYFSKKLFFVYLKQPYSFYLNKNSSQLVRNITTEIGFFANGIYSFLLVINELLVFFSISLFLLYFETFSFLIICPIVLIALFFFNYFTKKRNIEWGKHRQKYEGLRIKTLQESFGGIKDIKIFNIENYIYNQYSEINKNQATMNSLQSFIVTLPRIIFELVAVVGIFILILIIVINDKNSITLLPTLALFTAAAFRILPSLNRLSVSIQNIRFSIPVAKNIYNEINRPISKKYNSKNQNNFIFEKNISLNNISFSYQNNKKLFNNIDLEIKAGEVIGIIGDSGSGKTTLIDILMGILEPTSGEITIDGNNINKNLNAWYSNFGYVPQSVFLLDDTIKANIAFGVEESKINDSKIHNALKKSQLFEYVNNLPEGINTKIGERGVKMSGGQRQRLGIARCLYFEPSILFFDEATSSLDLETEELFIKSLNLLKGKTTMIIISHRKSTLVNCDRILKVEKGRIIKYNNI